MAECRDGRREEGAKVREEGRTAGCQEEEQESERGREGGTNEGGKGVDENRGTEETMKEDRQGEKERGRKKERSFPKLPGSLADNSYNGVIN